MIENLFEKRTCLTIDQRVQVQEHTHSPEGTRRTTCPWKLAHTTPKQETRKQSSPWRQLCSHARHWTPSSKQENVGDRPRARRSTIADHAAFADHSRTPPQPATIQSLGLVGRENPGLLQAQLLFPAGKSHRSHQAIFHKTQSRAGDHQAPTQTEMATAVREHGSSRKQPQPAHKLLYKPNGSATTSERPSSRRRNRSTKVHDEAAAAAATTSTSRTPDLPTPWADRRHHPRAPRCRGHRRRGGAEAPEDLFPAAPPPPPERRR
jgi:hypothetical protein